MHALTGFLSLIFLIQLVKVVMPLDESERVLSLKLALKMADLGHTSASLPVHIKWVSKLEEEVSQCCHLSPDMCHVSDELVYLVPIPDPCDDCLREFSWWSLSQFFRQGDLEKFNGMVVSPLFDRSKQGVTRSQIGFFDIVGEQGAQNLQTMFSFKMISQGYEMPKPYSCRTCSLWLWVSRDLTSPPPSLWLAQSSPSSGTSARSSLEHALFSHM